MLEQNRADPIFPESNYNLLEKKENPATNSAHHECDYC